MHHQDSDNIVLNKKEKVQQKQNPPGTSKFRALDSEDPPPPETIKNSISFRIQQARQLKKMTRKDLAKGLNIKEFIITEYETGKAIPNNQVLRSIGNILGIKLL
jgi:putative transcription factor